MKNKTSSIIITLLGILLAVGILTAFHPCLNEKKMSCFYAGRVEIALGILVAVLGIISFFTEEKSRAGIFTSIAGIGALAFLTPTVITGVCKMEAMHCRKALLPFSVLIGIAIVAAALVSSAVLLKKKK